MPPTCPRCGAEREPDAPCATCGTTTAAPSPAPDEALLERVAHAIRQATSVAHGVGRASVAHGVGRASAGGRAPTELPAELAQRLGRQAVLLRDQIAAHEQSRARLVAALNEVERALARGAPTPGEPDGPLVDVRLPRVQGCAELARRQVHNHCRALMDPPAAGEAALIASELVDNAYVHGRGAISLRVAVVAERLRIEVADEGSPSWIGVRAAVDGGTGGWGLWIVERLSLCWGTDPGSARVWAELPLRGSWR